MNDKKRPSDERLAKLVGSTAYRDMVAAHGKVDPLSGAGVQLAWALSCRSLADGTPDKSDVSPYVLASYVVGMPVEHEKIGDAYNAPVKHSTGTLYRGMRRLACYVALGELCGQSLNAERITLMLELLGSAPKALKVLVDDARSWLYTECSEAATRFAEASRE